MNRKCRLLAGRAGVIAAVVVFVVLYAYGLLAYGLVLGIGLGWLPCGILAWLAGRGVAFAVSHIPPRFIASMLQATSSARIVVFRTQHRH